ncbi:putative NAD(P)H nitroreductase YfhC [Halolactibacillus alkaliphilus]|uniref:Putative NAD(P)H nitroreductase n=1 Tax=Halolactibacillus alkaliphilus TaxID=442899 RepID=A0A511X3N1_9BACI|nr:nitroreductase [Halolactibacillus alkaliphilus]GEN57556.1 putative NAD(P)H nitroreductase YfhC [Halolactibacillus alkaliphilus]GGN73356.1 putative NAD(P)H nitroreductase YfhC [Halolactibacillus alkaliphilus]SFO96177.1 Nitroreductase [Halolactibacillus alkaliphilus]
MDIETLIKERRSVSLFEDKPVSIDEVKAMLKTSAWVPNHKMTQPWRFTIITGETKAQLAHMAGEFMSRGKTGEEKDRAYNKAHAAFSQVPMHVMVFMEESHDLKRRQEDYASTSLIIHNLSLIGWEKGIGMIWKTGPLTDTEPFRQLIGIQPGEKFVGMIQLGYPKKVPRAMPRIDLDERITELN